MRIEQAIFTSIQSSRLDGYQLAAASPGITDELARELTVWGPAHDSLWDTRRDARSVNFHALPTVPLLGRSDQPEPTLISQVLDEVGAKVFDDLVDAVAGPTSVAVLTSGH